MEHRRLTRSRTDRRLGGVAAGLARYFGIDPLLVRVAFVVAAFMGFGILTYLVLWLVLPTAQPGEEAAAYPAGSSPAIQIAEERYARGEITAEELNRIRADLSGTAR